MSSHNNLNQQQKNLAFQQELSLLSTRRTELFVDSWLAEKVGQLASILACLSSPKDTVYRYVKPAGWKGSGKWCIVSPEADVFGNLGTLQC